MALSPKITTEDVRLVLNGVYSGSSEKYYFWGQEITSGSVLSHINLSNYYLYSLLGKTVMDTTDEVKSEHVKTAELDYSCFRLLVALSGGVITEGLSWSTGPIKVTQQSMLPSYTNLINDFKNLAMQHIKVLQTFVLSYEWDVPNWKKTSTSVM